MSERYRAHRPKDATSWQVIDGETGEPIDDVPHTFDGALCIQNEKNNEANDAWTNAMSRDADRQQLRAAIAAAIHPSCDSAARLKAAEDKAERYRHALAQIIRYSKCPIASRYAQGALFLAERTKGET